ncbi:MAG: hypothetical protein GXX08_13385 [Firmicutes bacterium]|nr:hypothetical protein [Bacillota bacterium]
MGLSRCEYYSKVYGCWLGKTCGGTLGAPLEKVYGERELFDVWWYPSLPEGGIPNDDLELQLVWLQALEERGLDIDARVLAEYWLDCVAYNFDEYGLHKVNLKKGLLPPLSGYYNNWFKDCMGCPIRSEIWACIAPGMPNIAAKYAYEDAIVDHAGGESVYGEIFNAALESAAFVIDDKEKLVEIGLSFIPAESKTAIAIRDALGAYRRGLDWKDARNYVLDRSYSQIAQYSPVNLGFQTIGLLYGQDFGDAICKAVNCGYDTDCTGATVGAILGIIGGKEAIPEKWSVPIEDKITTNARWGGIVNLRQPQDLDELTRRVCAIGDGVLASSGVSLAEIDDTRLQVSDTTKALWNQPPNVISFDRGGVRATVEYVDGPAVAAGQSNRVNVVLESRRLKELNGEVTLSLPEGWTCSPVSMPFKLAAGGGIRLAFTVEVEDPADIDISNRGSARVWLENEPCWGDIPVVFLGSLKWLVSDRMDGDLDTPHEIERNLGPSGAGDGHLADAGDGWRVLVSPDFEVPIEGLFGGKPSVVYLRHYIYSPSSRSVRMGFPSTCPFRMWLNGEMVHEARDEGVLRPNLGGDHRSYATVELREGWNQVLVKAVRNDEPVSAHFILSTGNDWFSHGLTDVVQCRFPWESKSDSTTPAE